MHQKNQKTAIEAVVEAVESLVVAVVAVVIAVVTVVVVGTTVNVPTVPDQGQQDFSKRYFCTVEVNNRLRVQRVLPKFFHKYYY